MNCLFAKNLRNIEYKNILCSSLPASISLVRLHFVFSTVIHIMMLFCPLHILHTAIKKQNFKKLAKRLEYAVKLFGKVET